MRTDGGIIRSVLCVIRSPILPVLHSTSKNALRAHLETLQHASRLRVAQWYLGRTSAVSVDLRQSTSPSACTLALRLGSTLRPPPGSQFNWYTLEAPAAALLQPLAACLLAVSGFADLGPAGSSSSEGFLAAPGLGPIIIKPHDRARCVLLVGPAVRGAEDAFDRDDLFPVLATPAFGLLLLLLRHLLAAAAAVHWLCGSGGGLLHGIWYARRGRRRVCEQGDEIALLHGPIA